MQKRLDQDWNRWYSYKRCHGDTESCVTDKKEIQKVLDGKR